MEYVGPRAVRCPRTKAVSHGGLAATHGVGGIHLYNLLRHVDETMTEINLLTLYSYGGSTE